MYNTKMMSATKFECIVCRLKRDTISELHRHQTFLHTTEELSLAVIGRQSTLINDAVKSEDTFPCSWLYDPLEHSQFYVLSAQLLDDEDNFAGFDRSVPLNCVIQKRDLHVEEACLPKAGLLETLDDQKFRRRQQSRRRRIFHASNNGVLDLSVSKKNRNSRSKPRKYIENIFYQENQQTAVFANNKKMKKSSKDRSSKRKLPNDDLPIKLERILMDDKCYENELETIAVPKKHVTFSAEAVEPEKMIPKDKDNGEFIDREESCGNKKFAHPQSMLIPSHMRKFSCQPEADYNNKAEENEEPTVKKMKAQSRKKNPSSRRVGKKKSKRPSQRETGPKSENIKTSQGEKYKNSEVDENFNDNTCLDISEVREENDDTTEIVYEEVEIPDFGEEFYFNENCSDSSDCQENSQLEPFEGVSVFPTYPKDMDDHSILVFDPKSCGLVWTSFELVDDSKPPDNEKCPQNKPNDIQLDTNETSLENDENNISFNNLISRNSQANIQSFRVGLEKNKAILENEGSSTDTFISQRSRRRRSIPDRYVPS